MIALMVNPICSVRMLDCVDIWTLHLAQIQLIGERFPWRGWEFPISTDPVLQETCFQYVGKDNLKTEMDLLSQYNSILTISWEEADEIRKWVHGPIIETIPMCAETMFIDNTYEGPPLILGHNHPFNAQAYAYFIQRVLPFVHLTEPDFAFRLIGKDTNRFPGHPSADIAGFVEDIVDEYRRAAFLMVPVLGGTGQLTRVVEAMAHGLPVVATRAASRSSPILHGYNGFIADTAEEFAEYVVALNRDRQLARSMGQAALETVRTECSMEHLKQKMSAIIERK